jgi:NAD(P)-dependent dehydrogenase (short-subunit alcohol dehydrogenase family)
VTVEMGRVQGKIALITGANLGDDGPNIGGATALALAAEGADIVVADLPGRGHSRLAAEIERRGGRALAVDVDLRNERQIVALVDACVAHFGGLDIVHNNAGISPEADGDVAGMAAETWTAVMDVDARGALLVTKHAIPHLRDRGGGSIINTASITALAGDLIHTSYGMAKAALCSLTQHVAVQYGPENIRCNAICPGLTMTPAARQDLPGPLVEAFGDLTPGPALSTPEDQASIVVFLASDESRMLNGQILCTDGGLLSQQPWVPAFRAMGAPTYGNDRPDVSFVPDGPSSGAF